MEVLVGTLMLIFLPLVVAFVYVAYRTGQRWRHSFEPSPDDDNTSGFVEFGDGYD